MADFSGGTGVLPPIAVADPDTDPVKVAAIYMLIDVDVEREVVCVVCLIVAKAKLTNTCEMVACIVDCNC